MTKETETHKGMQWVPGDAGKDDYSLSGASAGLLVSYIKNADMQNTVTETTTVITTCEPKKTTRFEKFSSSE